MVLIAVDLRMINLILLMLGWSRAKVLESQSSAVIDLYFANLQLEERAK